MASYLHLFAVLFFLFITEPQSSFFFTFDKPFVIGRKNWIFANTGKVANASATIYIIIETAKSYGLLFEKYFACLLNIKF